MAVGPGKYDRFATLVRVVTGSAGVVLLAVGGEDGPGFSVQGTLEFQRAVPRLLRDIAAQVEADLPKLES